MIADKGGSIDIMKRIKELLWFVIPIVGFSIAMLLLWLFPATNESFSPPKFAGQGYYLKLLLSDPIFLKGLANTYGLSMLCGLAGIAIFTLITLLLKSKVRITRPLYYAVSGIIGSIGASIFIFCTVVMYRASRIVAVGIGYAVEYPSIFESITLYDILMALQCGVLAVFVVWIVEMVCRLIRRIKEKKAAE